MNAEELPDWLDEPMYETSTVDAFVSTVTELVSPRFARPDGMFSEMSHEVAHAICGAAVGAGLEHIHFQPSSADVGAVSYVRSVWRPDDGPLAKLVSICGGPVSDVLWDGEDDTEDELVHEERLFRWEADADLAADETEGPELLPDAARLAEKILVANRAVLERIATEITARFMAVKDEGLTVNGADFVAMLGDLKRGPANIRVACESLRRLGVVELRDDQWRLVV